MGGQLPPKKIPEKYFSGKNHVKFGHFVNLSCIYFRAKMSYHRKVDWAPTPMGNNVAYLLNFLFCVSTRATTTIRMEGSSLLSYLSDIIYNYHWRYCFCYSEDNNSCTYCVLCIDTLQLYILVVLVPALGWIFIWWYCSDNQPRKETLKESGVAR